MPSHSGLMRQNSLYGTQGRGGFDGSTDVTLNANERYVTVTTAGDIQIVPFGNDDDDSITFVSAPVGFVPPYRVKKVLSAGTDAVFATVRP